MPSRKAVRTSVRATPTVSPPLVMVAVAVDLSTSPGPSTANTTDSSGRANEGAERKTVRQGAPSELRLGEGGRRHSDQRQRAHEHAMHGASGPTVYQPSTYMPLAEPGPASPRCDDNVFALTPPIRQRSQTYHRAAQQEAVALRNDASALRGRAVQPRRSMIASVHGLPLDSRRPDGGSLWRLVVLPALGRSGGSRFGPTRR